MSAILNHSALGQTARFERFVADMLWFIAAGEHIDPNRTPKFSAQVERVYNQQAKEDEKPMTADEIKQHIIERIHEYRDGG